MQTLQDACPSTSSEIMGLIQGTAVTMHAIVHALKQNMSTKYDKRTYFSSCQKLCQKLHRGLHEEDSEIKLAVQYHVILNQKQEMTDWVSGVFTYSMMNLLRLSAPSMPLQGWGGSAGRQTLTVGKAEINSLLHTSVHSPQSTQVSWTSTTPADTKRQPSHYTHLNLKNLIGDSQKSQNGMVNQLS